MNSDRNGGTETGQTQQTTGRLPFRPLNPPRLAHPRRTKKLARCIARDKHQFEKENGMLVAYKFVTLYQRPPISDGLTEYDTFVSDETKQQVQGLLDELFDKEGLVVEDLVVTWTDLRDTMDAGTVILLNATFRVV